MYAKIINGRLQTAPKQVQYNGNIVFNPPNGVLAELGYLPVTYTDMPSDVSEGYHYEAGWTQNDTTIVQVWNLAADPEIPEPELTAEEVLAIIMGVTS